MTETQRSSHGSEPDENKGVEAHPAPAGSAPVAWVDPLDLAEKQQSFMACSDQYESTHSNLRFKVPLYLGAAPVAQPSPQPSDELTALVSAWAQEAHQEGHVDLGPGALDPIVRALAARSFPPSGAHTDHPVRHWDRTCPACVDEAERSETAVRRPVDGGQT